MTVEELKEAHGGHWGEHSDYPLSDWQHEVADENTRLGYWEWVHHELETAGESYDRPAT